MLDARCSMLNAQCSMLNAQCSMLNAQCSMLTSYPLPLYSDIPDRQGMAHTSTQYKQMPDGVHVLNFLEGIQHGSNGIKQTTGN